MSLIRVRPCSAVVPVFSLWAAILLAPAVLAEEAAPKLGVFNPLHGYQTRPVNDRFTRLLAEIDAGKVQLDDSGDLPFLGSLLKQLEVPVSSQMLVFTA